MISPPLHRQLEVPEPVPAAQFDHGRADPVHHAGEQAAVPERGGAQDPTHGRLCVPACQFNGPFMSRHPETGGANRSESERASGPGSLPLYAALNGQGVLRAYVQGTDDLSRAAISNLAAL